MRALSLSLAGILFAIAAPTSAQVPPLRVVSIDGVSPAHALRPDGVDVLRVSVQNTTDVRSRPTTVRCELGHLVLSGPVPHLDGQSSEWVVLGLPLSRRAEVPSGGTFARCALELPGAHGTTTMVYTGPALVPDLRFGPERITVQDCESTGAPTAGREVCAYLDVENVEQTLGPIGGVRVTTRCEIGSVRREEVRALREVPVAAFNRSLLRLELGAHRAGTHRLECRLDATNAVSEGGERDNVVAFDVEVEAPAAARYDVAVVSLLARYEPWLGHEAPQPDHLTLYVDLENRGDAPIVAGEVECTIDGRRLQADFGAQPPRSIAPGARTRARVLIAEVPGGTAPPPTVRARCRAGITRPARTTDANPADNTRSETVTVEGSARQRWQ